MLTSDPIEATRRRLLSQVNAVTQDEENKPRSPEDVRKDLEARHGQVWSTAEMTEEFEAIGFGAPFAVVRRRSDGVKGSLSFTHSPRFYYGFEPA